MRLFDGQNVIRLKLNDNNSVYWGGKGFVHNRAYARRYKTPARALRVMNALCRFAHRTSDARRLGIHLYWRDVHGLVEVCALGVDDASNGLCIPRGNHCISWLVGYESFCGDMREERAASRPLVKDLRGEIWDVREVDGDRLFNAYSRDLREWRTKTSFDAAVEFINARRE